MNKIRLLFCIFGIVSFSAFGAEFPTFDVNAVLAQAAKKKKYPCTMCEKAFNRSSHLKDHEKTHNQEKPFECKFQGCGKAFTRSNNLKIHERRHSGAKPCRCTINGCGKAFADPSSLHRHAKTHNRKMLYTCSIEGCEKVFTDRSNLQRHAKTHTGDRPYKCSIEQCEKAFARPSDLRRHEGTPHEGLLLTAGPTPEVMEAARLLMDFTKNGGSDE